MFMSLVKRRSVQAIRFAAIKVVVATIKLTHKELEVVHSIQPGDKVITETNVYNVEAVHYGALGHVNTVELSSTILKDSNPAIIRVPLELLEGKVYTRAAELADSRTEQGVPAVRATSHVSDLERLPSAAATKRVAVAPPFGYGNNSK